MRKEILYSICLAAALLWGCEKTSDSPSVDTPQELMFSKSLGEETPTYVSDNATFRMVLFSGANPINYTNGAYRYDPVNTVLLPCAVDTYGLYDVNGTIAKMYAVKGNYKLYITHPAKLIQQVDGVSGATFNRNYPFYVSQAKDITVEGSQPQSIKGVELKDMRALLVIALVYGDNKVTIANTKIADAGSDNSTAFFSMQNGITRNITGDELISFTDDATNKTLRDTSYLYSSDYTLSFMKAPAVTFSLSFTANGKTKNIRVPLVYKLSPMTTYRLTMNLTAVDLDISLTAQGWSNVELGGDVGDPPPVINIDHWTTTIWEDVSLDGEVGS